MLHTFESFDRQKKPLWLVIIFASITLLGGIDYLSGYEASVAVFYLLPVSLAAWLAGRLAGVAASVVSAATWLMANLMAGETFSNVIFPYWNAATFLAFFLVVVLLVSRFRDSMDRERSLARTDYLTGAVNARAFYEIAQAEISRARRYARPVTITYIDVDNFKVVNDQLGHPAGDTLLRTVAETVRGNLRASDVFSRLGGDEFAILMPETEYDAAERAIAKIQERLLDEMRKNEWPVTFSIGVLTCPDPPDLVDEMIKMADKLMYTVKNKGKNRIRHEIFAAKLFGGDVPG